MHNVPFIILAQNAALLLAATMIFDLVAARLDRGNRNLGEIPVGLALGLIGLVVMLTPWTLAPGIVFDTRSVLLGLTGLFFGTLPTLIVMVITAAFRLYQGGAGALTGILVILATGATGLLWRRFRRAPLADIGWRELFLFGLVVHLVMLAIMATLPREAVLPVISRIALPVLTLYPLGTALLGALMANRLRRAAKDDVLREAELQFRRLANAGPGLIWTSKPDRQRNYFNQPWLAFTGRLPAQELGEGWLAGVHPEDREACLAAYNAACDRRERFSMTYRLRRHDGAYRWIQDDGSPRYDTREGFLGFIGYCLDVTEQKEREQALRDREVFLAGVLATTQDGFLVVNGRGRITEANEAYARMCGYTLPELKELSITDLDADENPDDTDRRIARIMKNGSERFEARHRRKDGTLFDVEVSTAYLEMDGGLFVCFFRDITARKRAEAQHIRLMRAVEQVEESIVITDADGIIQYVNPAFESVTGYASNEAVGRTPRLLKSDRHDEAFYSRLWATISSGNTWRGEIVNKRKDGTLFIENATISPVSDEAGFILNYVAVKRDVTALKEAEERLRKSEEKYYSLFNQSTEGIYLHDLDGRILDVNQTACEQSGYSREEYLNRTVFDLHPGNRKTNLSKAEILQAWSRWKPGQQFIFEAEHQRKDGVVYPVEVSTGVVGYGDVKAVLAIVTDITQRREAEAKAEETSRLITNLARLVPGVIYQYSLYPDGSSAFPYASPGMNDIYEVTPEEVRQDATPVFGRLHPEDHDRVAEAIFESARTLETFYCEFRVILPRQGLRWRWSQAQPQRLTDGGTLWHGIILDITERKLAEEERAKLEHQLRQAQKMEAIGTMAGGIAHDFNNILGAISGYTELSLMKLRGDSRIKRYLEQIHASCQRAINLVRQILEFSRLSEKKLITLRVTPLVKEMIKLLREVIPSTIEVRLDIRTEADMIRGDATQIHQILMNLCTNAYQAMQDTGGLLEVTLDAAAVPEIAGNEEQQGLKPGAYLKLTVHDTGPGIDPLIRERIFDPFFTTKKIGEGTGLGLSVVHGIVSSYGGKIVVESLLGKGTSFSVYLPLAGEAESAVPGKVLPALLEGEGRILLVDDEVTLTTMMKEMLEALGFTVTVKTSSVEALETFSAQSDQFDLVITDLTMPILTGIALAEKLISLRGDIPIILYTGFLDSAIEERTAKAGIRNVVLKPVAMERLVPLIRTLLSPEAKQEG